MQGSGSFGSIIGASRFGISRDLQMGQDEINKIRGGRTTEQIIADARANAAARGNQAGMINNGELSNRQPAGFTSGSITANINLNGNLDFTPIFNEVERLIDSKRQQQIAEISSVVQRIVDKKWDVVKPPRIDGR